MGYRSVEGDPKVIQNNMKRVQEQGFINYFGMQRFGTGNVPSHHVGRAVLQGDWKLAVELILDPNNRQDTGKALMIYKETGDIPKTLRQLKPYTIEHRVLTGLIRNGKTAFYNAFSCLPTNMKTLYVHSYQSFIWNSIVSLRLEQHGLQVVEGDLVLLSEQPILHNERSEEEEAAEMDQEEVDLDSKMRQQVHVVTAEEVSCAAFSITDVVLPLPGSDVANNTIMAKQYEELMAKDNLKFDLDHKNK
jgi:tRNA pseudouridine13 synthase